jgi:hypothetical protein
MAEATQPATAASRGRQPSRLPRSAPAHGADRNRLPAAPVLRAIQRRAWLRHQSLRELLGPELVGAYGNAQAAGTISLVTLERFCDEVLGWHPRMLYGDAYDQAAVAPHL